MDKDKSTSAGQNEGPPGFYTKAQQYWSTVPATVDGMLGGLGYISTSDIEGSAEFLNGLERLQKTYALDCGAGIGRISRGLLLPMFERVDLVEQDPSFAEKAKFFCTADVKPGVCYKDRLGEVYNMGLQDFLPEEGKYSLIWSQWVLGHLTDEDLVLFFQRVQRGLMKGGYFVMKENVTSSNETEKDDVDSSVTRSHKAYQQLLVRADFRIVQMTRQRNFPKGLYPVYMIACQSNVT